MRLLRDQFQKIQALIAEKRRQKKLRKLKNRVVVSCKKQDIQRDNWRLFIINCCNHKSTRKGGAV